MPPPVQDPGSTVSTYHNPSTLPVSSAAKVEVLPLQGFVMLALLSVIWGINWPIIKFALTEVPVFSFRAICLVGGGLGLLALARLGGYSIRLPRHIIGISIISAFFNVTGWHIMSGFAVAVISSGHAAIIGYTMPVWGVLLSALVLREPLTWRRMLSLALGMAGLAVLAFGELRAVEGVPYGALLMAGAALSWGIGTIIMKKVSWGAPIAVVVAWQCLIGAVPIAGGALIFDWHDFHWPSLWPLLAVIYNLIFAFVIGHYLYYKVVSIFPVGVATIGTLAIPVLGLLSGAFALGEPLGALEISALVLVACALALPIVTQPSSVSLARVRNR